MPVNMVILVRQYVTIIAMLFTSFLVLGCNSNSEYRYTLYRTGIDFLSKEHDESLRIHVASFDATPLKTSDENRKYNLANCEFAKKLFEENQPHYSGSEFAAIKIKYWCEIGRLK